ncbi:MAG: hypothetical protein JRG86_19865 [Deltaproteobacteria bacterium]|jgi:hypothetical protein|nr:hypothetical protein [Deltaproteobacteria bacterium]MBW2498039.1 hypothetical protein [Deltaproteobacteria bacterium]
MQIEIEPCGIEVESEWPEFIRTTIAFSAWRHEPRVERVRVALRSAGLAASPLMECRLEAIRSDGSFVTTKAFGSDAFEAVQAASEKFEVELFRSASAAYRGEPQLYAA